MTRHALRLFFAVALLAVILSPALAQVEVGGPKKDPKKEPPKKDEVKSGDDYRELFKKPENAMEFWKAMQFEIEVGRYNLAAKHLRGLLDIKPDEASLMEIQDKEGLSGFLRLRNIPKWSTDKDVEAQVRKDIEDLIKLVSDALQKTLEDQKRIEKYVANLQKSPEEKEFAIKELYRSGPAAIPYLLDALKPTTGEERANIVEALTKMPASTTAPLVAALDSDDNALVLDIIRVLRNRGSSSAAAGLWYVAGASNRPEAVRDAARKTLGLFTETHPDRLLSGKFALTREAERYFQHKVQPTLPEKVTIWRWDDKKLVKGWPGNETVTAARAEEYYGLRYAGQALEIDPTYPPAQVVFLTLALERAMKRGGLDQPLAKTDPEVYRLLTTVNPSLVNSILERGLSEQKVLVILGAVRALGDLSDTRAALPTRSGDPALSRAVLFPDRRVQMAAADTILRLPVRPSSVSTTRIVEVLRRAVAADPGIKVAPKVIVAQFNQDLLRDMGIAVEKAGYEPIRVRSGREVLRRLNEAADIEAMLIDVAVPDPELPYLLGQVRADVHGGLLPVIVLAPTDRVDGLRRTYERYRNVFIFPAVLGLDVDGLKATLPKVIIQAMEQEMTDVERKAYAEAAILWLARLARGEKAGYDVRPAGDTVLNVLRQGQMSEAGQAAAIEIAGRLPGSKPQIELANMALDSRRPLPLRTAAASELARHIQQHGAALGEPLTKGVQDQSRDATVDPGLRANLGLVIGSMRPDAKTTGDRLKGFKLPPPPAPTEPMPPKEKEKEPKEPKEPPKDS